MKYNRNDPSKPVSSKSTKVSPLVNGYGVLRSVLEKACDKSGCSLGELTVLSPQVDPYRLDVPSAHRDGAWVGEHFDRLIGPTKKIHWRGLHYTLVSTSGLVKPNSQPFLNNDDDWTWLTESAGKAARWLGYIDFARIIDQRNAPPIIHRKASITPKSSISVGVDVDIPDVDALEPRPIAKTLLLRDLWREGEP